MTTPSARDLLLGVKTPGLVFGELSAIDQRPRSASATKMEPSTIATMSSDELLDSLQTAPTIAGDLLRSLAEQLRRSKAQIGARYGANTTVRVGHLLLELGEKFRRHGAGLSATSAIGIPISQDELASWIGASREATARSLVTFRQSGAISTGRQCVTMHNVEWLLAVTGRAT